MGPATSRGFLYRTLRLDLTWGSKKTPYKKAQLSYALRKHPPHPIVLTRSLQEPSTPDRHSEQHIRCCPCCCAHPGSAVIPCYVIPYYTALYFTVQYCTILSCTLLYSTLLYSTLLYSTLLYSTLLYLAAESSTLPEFAHVEARGGQAWH